jgi:hypothetical protein
MSEPWNPDVLRPLPLALPAPRRLADVFETVGGEAFVIEHGMLTVRAPKAAAGRRRAVRIG